MGYVAVAAVPTAISITWSQAVPVSMAPVAIPIPGAVGDSRGIGLSDGRGIALAVIITRIIGVVITAVEIPIGRHDRVADDYSSG